MTQNTCSYKVSSIVKSNQGITRKYSIPIAIGFLSTLFYSPFSFSPINSFLGKLGN